MFNQSQISNSTENSTSSQVDESYSHKNYLNAKAYRFSDSDGIVFNSLDVIYKREKITESISLSADAGIFSIEDTENKYNGTRYGGTLQYDNFSMRLGINKYTDFSEFVPSIFYEDVYENHSYILEYTRQNALFYTYSPVAYEKKIVADHFSLSDYITFDNNTTLWTNVVLNSFSNNDTEITGQFDWVFHKGSYFTPKFTYDLALEGWYTTHSKQHSDFYSPSFADATLLRFDPQYIFSKYLGVKGTLATGVSISDNAIPYKYGLWFFGEPIQDLDYSLGCLQSNAARLSSQGNYFYRECRANLGYAW